MLCAVGLFAAPISLTNGSFESGASATASCGGTCAYSTTGATVSGWVTNSRAGVQFNGTQTGVYGANDDGGWRAYVDSVAIGDGASGLLTSTTSILIVPGMTYTVSVDIQHGPNQIWPTGTVNFQPFVALLANNVAVQGPAYLATDPGAGNTWVTLTGSWTAPASFAGQSLAVQLGATNYSAPSVPGSQAFFDNVRLDATPAPTPEPATMALGGLGLLALGLVRRYRKSA